MILLWIICNPTHAIDPDVEAEVRFIREHMGTNRDVYVFGNSHTTNQTAPPGFGDSIEHGDTHDHTPHP